MTPLETTWHRGDRSSVQAAGLEHLCLGEEERQGQVRVISVEGQVAPLHSTGLFPEGPVPESLVLWF